ncbi:MAG: methylcobamide--CoM methyltransferase [Dehalococcoidia bacterium]
MLTTVVGSYPKIPNRPRPARLRAAIARFERGEIGPEELARVQDEVTVEVMREQAEAGIDIISDGQIRWDDDQTYIARRLDGFGIDGLQRYLDTNTYFRQPEVVGPVRWREPVLVEDYRFATEHSPKPVKAIVTGPYTLAALSHNQHYGSRRDLTLALAEALRQEVLALQEAGAPIIQVNEPVILQRGEDFPILREALGRMLEGVKVETALYTWFGSIEGVYRQLLDLPVATLGIDFVSKPFNWEVLKAAPFTKKLGYGIVDGRNTRIESVEEIVGRIQAAVGRVPPERLYVNPSCSLEYLPREVAQAKLARLVEGVRQAQVVLGERQSTAP